MGRLQTRGPWSTLIFVAECKTATDNSNMKNRERCRSLVLQTFILCLVLISTGPAVDGQAGDNKRVFERLDRYATAEAAEHSFRGAVLVGVKGRVVFKKAYGMADDEWNVHNTTTTKFRIASLSKQFTAACILQLQERGRLKLKDPISRYLSGLPEAWQSITIHQLLTHTSGIPNYTDSPEFAKLRRTGATPQEMIGLVADKPLDFKPGSQWRYSNTGYILLGMIIERTSGQPYSEFMRSNIFVPLGMTNSGYDRAADILKERASGYRIKDGAIANGDFIDMTVPYAAGGIYSTVEDMFRWNEALAQDGKLLSEDSLKQMFTEYSEAIYQGQHYGYGVVISRQKFGKLLYYHGGGVEGFSSSIQRYPSQQVCIVVLSNLESFKPWEMGDHIAADLFQQALLAGP
jgi:CubicO group peptidase (beta-lactamase class C family)